MNILSLIDGMSEDEIGKMIVGEMNSFICEKAQTLLDGLMKNEIIDYFADASNATEGNFRNGYYSRTLNTVYGPLTLRVPRDRIGQFKTEFFVPYKRTTDNICEMIQRLYVRGMTEREIVDEINDDFGTSLSVNVNVNLYIFTGVKMYIICSCFLSHQLMGQEWSAVQHTLWS